MVENDHEEEKEEDEEEQYTVPYHELALLAKFIAILSSF